MVESAPPAKLADVYLALHGLIVGGAALSQMVQHGETLFALHKAVKPIMWTTRLFVSAQ